MKYLAKWSILCLLMNIGCVSCDSENFKGDAVDPNENMVSLEQAILNGSVDKDDPGVVGLFHPTSYEKGSDGQYTYYGDIYCSGTLIHPQWVLTAAHCVTENKDGYVFPSNYNLSMMILVGYKLGGSFVFDTAGSEQIYWPKEYNVFNEGADIALIKLNKPMSSEYASPILPLPEWLSINKYDLPESMRLVGFGYDHKGISNTKNTKTVSVSHYCGPANPYDISSGCNVSKSIHVVGCHPNEYLCDEYGYADAYVNSLHIPYRSFFHEKTSGGECHGDSGGPSLLKIDGVEYVAAVTSYGDQFCRGYNVNTAVQDFYDWIISIAPEVGSQFKEICGNKKDDDGNGLIDDMDPACIYCGNNIVNIGEECDGSKFSQDHDSCQSWDSSKYLSGTLLCNSDCTVDTSKCVLRDYCGDGKLSEFESCDGTVFKNNLSTCESFDPTYTSGQLKCTSDCKIDESNCKSNPVCGDGKVHGDEACDGTQFRENRTLCHSWYPDAYEGGTLKCTSECKFDTSECKTWCGNGKIDSSVGEVCDGSNFKGATCATLVGEGSKGTLKCTDNCSVIDTSGCSEPTTCGNGKLDPGEDCDYHPMSGYHYRGDVYLCYEWDKNYSSGSLKCNADCTVDLSSCKLGTCGDGKVNREEDCDGTITPYARECINTFPKLYSYGLLKCTDDCKYDTSGCTPWCGNGGIDDMVPGIGVLNENCDHGDNGDVFPLSANTCEKVVGEGSKGSLYCSVDCRSIIVTGCSEPTTCGNGKLDAGEDCDKTSSGVAYLNDKLTCNQWNKQFSGGSISCNPDCTVNITQCTGGVCGDGVVNQGEDCDGEMSPTAGSCSNQFPALYSTGTLKCTDSCRFDLSDCKPWCGNGVVNVTAPDGTKIGEKCDHSDNGDVFPLSANTCEKVVGEGSKGTLYCASDCSGIIVTDCSKPTTCGNGKLNAGEDCDETSSGTVYQNNKLTCNHWNKQFSGGSISCNPDCTVNVTQCTDGVCGDGVVNYGEDCDGEMSPTAGSCSNQFPALYSTGTLKCTDSCRFDLSDCKSWCGNGVVNETAPNGTKIGEKCDHSAMGDAFPASADTCEKVVGEGSRGTLSCAADCSGIITINCSPAGSCGDGEVNRAKEQCDGSAFRDNKTQCSDWDNKYIGNVSCNENCTINLANCALAPICGDNIINQDSEECDGSTFNAASNRCRDLDSQYAAGRVTCSGNCKVDYSACRLESELTDEICTSGYDEDGDELIDCSDPDCADDDACKTIPVCGDGIVNGTESCDGKVFLNGAKTCHDWIPAFKSGGVTCNSDCTINYDICLSIEPGICSNGIDDDLNGLIDCDDPLCDKVCADLKDSSHNKDSDCSAAPYGRTTALPLFLLLGSCVLVRRRRISK